MHWVDLPVLLIELQVEEMLMYTAELKLSSSLSKAHKQARVDETIEQLGLQSCRKTRIGTEMSRGISGGQAKRVNIGIALITDPKVLFLDEPTTGLDSFTSNEVMQVVREVADSGVTVCCTIHSPTEVTFRLFDSLIMLVRGNMVGPSATLRLEAGHLRDCLLLPWQVYSGPHGRDAIKHFHQSGFEFTHFEEGDSEAEWLVSAQPLPPVSSPIESPWDLLPRPQVNTVTACNSDPSKVQTLTDLYNKSDLALRNKERLDRSIEYEKSHGADSEQRKTLAVQRPTETSLFKALMVLFQYRGSRNLRSMEYIMQRSGDKFLVGFIMATLYIHAGESLTPQAIQSTAAVLFMLSVMPLFGGEEGFIRARSALDHHPDGRAGKAAPTLLLTARNPPPHAAAAYVPAIFMERALYARERNDGMYTPLAYLIYKVIEELTVICIGSLIVTTFIWFGIRLQGEWIFFWLSFLVMAAIGVGLAYFISSTAPSMDAANALVPLYGVVALYFCGFLMTRSQIPRGWKW